MLVTPVPRTATAIRDIRAKLPIIENDNGVPMLRGYRDIMIPKNTSMSAGSSFYPRKARSWHVTVDFNGDSVVVPTKAVTFA